MNDSERDVALHSAALVVVEMVPSFLYPLSRTIADYLSLSQRSEAQRSAAVVEIGLYAELAFSFLAMAEIIAHTQFSLLSRDPWLGSLSP